MNFIARVLTGPLSVTIGRNYIAAMRNLSSDSIFDDMIGKFKISGNKSGNKSKSSKIIGPKRINAASASEQRLINRKLIVPRATMEDVEVDCKVKEFLASDGPSRAVDEMWERSVIDGKFPTKKTMLTLCAGLSSEGNYSKIQTVAHLCKIAFPQEHLAQVGYRHYVAEAFWKIGRYSDAIQLFQQLFCTHEHMRHKVANMSKFLFAKVLTDRIDDTYALLLQFAGSCVKFGHFTVATNLWSLCFQSEHYDVQNLSEKLLEDNPDMLKHISKKLLGIASRAQDDGNLSVFQRLIQFALMKNLYEDQKTIFGAYLEYLCDLEDTSRATAAFNYICQYEIQLPAATVEKYANMMIRKKQKVPFVILGKENTPRNKPFQFRF